MTDIAKPPRAAAAPTRPSKPSQLVLPRKQAERSNALTHERLNEQMEAFRQSGGRIEVLGTTQSLRHIQPESDSNSQSTASARKRSR